MTDLIEIIARTERRRKFSDAEKAAINKALGSPFKGVPGSQGW